MDVLTVGCAAVLLWFAFVVLFGRRLLNAGFEQGRREGQQEILTQLEETRAATRKQLSEFVLRDLRRILPVRKTGTIPEEFLTHAEIAHRWKLPANLN